MPLCSLASREVHHCFPRSFLRGQPYEWVRFEDGTVIGNRIGFCSEHHRMLTGEIGGYRAKLTWENGLYYWEGKEGDQWVVLDALSAQPPAAGQRDPHVDVHNMLRDGAQCPVCGHVKKAGARETPRPGKDPARPRREWTVLVPDDSEPGTKLLDEWVEDFAVAIGASGWSKRHKRYHVLSVVLAWAMINRAEFIADIAEAAERRLVGTT